MLIWAAEQGDTIEQGALIRQLYKVSENLDFSYCDMELDPLLGKHDMVRSAWNKGYAEWESIYFGDPAFEKALPYREWNAVPPATEPPRV